MKMCSVPDCSKRMLAHGYCSRHYSAWRKYGDSLKRVRIERGTALRWMTQLSSEIYTDNCVAWPFKSKSGNGYGLVWFEGRQTGAHRVMCIIVNGPAPEGMEAAHSCGNRICVNPRHLRWATPAENSADMLIHGTNAQAKLTEDEVQQIVGLINQGKKQREIADLFGISRANICSISRGLIWKHISKDVCGPRETINAAEALQLYKMHRNWRDVAMRMVRRNGMPFTAESVQKAVRRHDIQVDQ